jgi:hypothetical protein
VSYSQENKPLQASGAEVVLLLLLVIFGMGLCVWVERAFTWRYTEPTEQQFLGTPAITEKQDALTRLESLKKEVETQLVAAEIDRIKQTATIKSLETLYPEINKPQQGGSTSISDEVRKTYEAAKNQKLASEELTALLNGRVSQLKSEAKATSESLGPEKQAARRAFQNEKTKYLIKKLAVAFLVPFAVVMMGLFLVRSFLRGVVKRPVWTSQGPLAYAIVAGSLLILLGYQTLEVAGAVLVGLILFLIILWKINWSARIGAPVVIENANPDTREK